MPALKKTPANSHAPEQQPEQPQMRVAMLPAPGMGTIYANAFRPPLPVARSCSRPA